MLCFRFALDRLLDYCKTLSTAEETFSMSSQISSPPPYFANPPDLLIPIPNTNYRLPLTWQHVKAIEQLARFFARLYAGVQRSEEKTSLNNYFKWSHRYMKVRLLSRTIFMVVLEL